MKTRILLFVFIGGLTLSGCESVDLPEMNPFGQKAADPYSVENVQMRADTGAITPLPQGSYPMGNSSVEVFDDAGFSQDYQSSRSQVAQGSMPSYGGGVLTSDSSVTIFSLDGAPQMVGAGGEVDYYADNTAGQGYAPYNNSGNSFSSPSGNQIFFKHGSSRLGGGDMSKLSNVAEQAKFAPVNRITVAGYASQPTQAGSHSVSGHILNLKESMNRSFAVSKALMKKGVPAEKIKTVSWGSSKPTGNNTQDRRVDIVMGEQ